MRIKVRLIHPIPAVKVQPLSLGGQAIKLMIRRLTVIAFFTGLGQLFTIFALKYVSQFAYATDLKAIAEVDSALQLLLNIVAMGLQSAAMRDLALSTDWKNEFGEIQSARVSLGVLLMLLACFYRFNPFYLVFLFSPIIAWNGDYALYARGNAIAGSIVALIRLLIPFSAIIVLVHVVPGLLPWIYMAITIGVYAVTNLAISLYLKTRLFFLPRFKNLRLYIRSLSLGVVVVSLYFIGLGLMLVVPYFYPNPVVAVAFLGLKFYMVFKGALRIIHQAFIKEMISYDVCFKVDQLAGLIGLTFLRVYDSLPTYPHQFVFGEKFLGDQLYFILLSIAALIYSLFSSLIIKAMLEKKDRRYAMVSLFRCFIYNCIVYCIISVLSLFLRYWYQPGVR